MTKRELKLLKSFLRSKGAYTKFKLNRKRLRRRGIADLGYCSIACAFIWSDTPEGRDYWKRLNDELIRKQVLLKYKESL